MRKKIIIITTSLIILLMLSLYFSSISNAAIEIKSGTTAHTGINASNAYQYCYDMRSSASTLGNNTLDPHLTLNADWGATVYLGASAYGNVRDNDGESITINGTTYNSTTNNITGVMNSGKFIITASLFESHTLTDGINFPKVTKLDENMNTKYVEKIQSKDNTIENTKGMAFAETSKWWGESSVGYYQASYPVLYRTKMFGHGAYQGEPTGSCSYRPVIWN